MIDMTYIRKIRHFNRFYTQILGLLNNKFLKSDYSLTEARILFEFAQRSNYVSKDLVQQLHLDPAYLSRLLMRFEKQGLIQKEQSLEDTRKQVLSLTSHGKSELSKLQKMSNLQIISSLANTGKEEQIELVKAMEIIEGVFSGKPLHSETFTIRSYRTGNIGSITYKHAIFYSKSYGFDHTFDAYVASGMAEFVNQYDPDKDHLWVVETGTAFMGSIAIVKSDEDVAQLRWFLIKTQVRGKGLGKKLLHEAIEFCKRHNYKKIILWTVSNLEVARRLYDQSGFKVKTTKSHKIWGQELTEELWELKLK